MNAELSCKELELAAYELSEAAAHERAAKALRSKAVKRIAAVHSDMRGAIETYQTKRKEKTTAL